jgi:hypothetical protein
MTTSSARLRNAAAPNWPKLSEIADPEQVHTTLAAVLTAGCTDLAECS